MKMVNEYLQLQVLANGGTQWRYYNDSTILLFYISIDIYLHQVRFFFPMHETATPTKLEVSQ